jgi:acyl-CoA thioester hydrolase
LSVFLWYARAYYEDTDAGGVVYYANYLRFFERARTEWLRSLGHSQQALAADPGVLFTVASVKVDYRRPARLDDLLAISCEPAPSSGAKLTFSQRIWRGEAAGELLCEAEVLVVCVNAASFRPQRVPDFILKELG